MQVLWRTLPQSGDEQRLLMLGWPAAAWHLELVDDALLEPTPTDEDLLVLYLGTPVNRTLVQCVLDAGGREVRSRNPYWDEWGVTIEDPDGYRVVLSYREWANAPGPVSA